MSNKSRIVILLAALPLALLCGCRDEEGARAHSATSLNQLKIEILEEYPHDTGAFTQGLLWHNGFLFESTGRYGRSEIRKLRLETGDVLLRRSLPPSFFGEGLARIGNRLTQITWMEQTAFVYDLGTLKETARIQYSGEGWGLCFDGNWLIMSDGSSKLTFRDPASLAVWKTVEVTLDDRPVSNLNELEYVEGRIYANIWQTSLLVEIDPESGIVTAQIDTSSLPYTTRRAGEDVLNGIAYRPDRGTFLLTGKLWPSIYEVRFIPQD